MGEMGLHWVYCINLIYMLELSALGLLQRSPLHGYRLKQQLELFMSNCISVNYGAIYPLLKRLQAQDLIATLAEESGDSGPSRKIYTVTAKGRERWRQKMLDHPHESWVNSRSRFAIKFFFFSDIEPELRVKLLEKRLTVCRGRQESVAAQLLPEDPYQKEAWLRHLAILTDEIEWLEAQLRNLSFVPCPLSSVQMTKD